jgi:hypothetical protein
MCNLITSKGTDIDENIANQNHATRTRTPKPGYLNLSNARRKNSVFVVFYESATCFPSPVQRARNLKQYETSCPIWACNKN